MGAYPQRAGPAAGTKGSAIRAVSKAVFRYSVPAVFRYIYSVPAVFSKIDELRASSPKVVCILTLTPRLLVYIYTLNINRYGGFANLLLNIII